MPRTTEVYFSRGHFDVEEILNIQLHYLIFKISDVLKYHTITWN